MQSSSGNLNSETDGSYADANIEKESTEEEEQNHAEEHSEMLTDALQLRNRAIVRPCSPVEKVRFYNHTLVRYATAVSHLSSTRTFLCYNF